MADYLEALQEVYVEAPSDTVILNTIELRHSTFDNGAVRMVRNYEDLTATLEDDAPLNASESVVFSSFSFDFTLPPISEQSNPRITVTIDGVDLTVVSLLDLAITTLEPIKITYRPYLSTDTSTPQMRPILHMTLTDVAITVQQVTGTAILTDFSNLSFPSVEYNTTIFPMLQDG